MGRQRQEDRHLRAIEQWHEPQDVRARFRGCLLGGAIGDALGAPLEFLGQDEIIATYGPRGLTDFAAAYGRVGAITDDTQMTLFTAEALLRLRVGTLLGLPVDPTELACSAYLRWLHTQSEVVAGCHPGRDGLLLGVPALHARRGPGTTCLEALSARAAGSAEPAANDRKGCGGVMRMAPVGLVHVDSVALSAGTIDAFDMGVRFAALTHGHPTGSLTAGAFASILSMLAIGAPLDDAIDKACNYLIEFDRHGETFDAILNARRLARSEVTPDATAVESLGGGWIAEEALAIGLYAALVGETFAEGVLLAVNHGGDSDSTGAIAGNLLGTMHGVDGIPTAWREHVELGGLVLGVADDLYEAPSWTREDAQRLAGRYPPR